MRSEKNDVGISIAENKGSLLFEEYTDRIHYGDEAHDEALHGAIEYAFRNHSAEQRADLYARIESKWKETPVGNLLGMVIKEIREWRNT